MKSVILVFFSFLILPNGFGQTTIDDLRAQIGNMPDDTSKVWKYNELFLAYFRNQQYDKLLETAKDGFDLATRLEYRKGMGKMQYYMAASLQQNGGTTEALALFSNTLQLVDDPAIEAKIYLNIGAIHHRLGDLDLALKSYFKANEIYEKTGKKDEHAKLLNNIGIIYRTQKKYERSKEIYLKSFALKKELNDSLGMAASLQNIGILHKYVDTLDDRGIKYLNQSRQIYEQMNRTRDVAGCLSAIGSEYVKLEKWDEAEEALAKAWAYFEKNPEHEFTAPTLFSLSAVATHNNDLAHAEAYLVRGLELTKELQQKHNILGNLLALAEVQSKMGKSSIAYQTLNEAYELRDSLNEENRLSAMEEMQAKFEVKQKDNELKISQLELSERTRQRNFSRYGAVGLALLALGIFFGFRSRMKANQKIAAQNEEIQKQRISQLEQEKKLTALSAMLEGEEKERTRIANDLHDGLGGLLTSVKSHFNSLGVDVESTPLFSKTNQLIDEACGEVRRISHNMMPRALALSGLPGALEDLAQNIRQKGLTCELEVIGMEEIDLPKAKAISLFRIIQELTNNVVKHAGAESLLLQLINRNGELTIIVEDDGRGFDVSKSFRKKGLGLTSVTSRVEFLKGEIDWDAVPGEGTTVSVHLSV